MISGRRGWVSGFLILTVSFFFAALFPLSILNLTQIADAWKDRIQIRVFLHSEASNESAQRLQEEWKRWQEIEEVRWTSRDHALEQLISDRSWQRERDAVLTLVEALGGNPLPHTLTLVPRPDFRSAEEVQKLSKRLQSLPDVTEVLYDRQGIENLDLFSERVKTLEMWGGGVMGVFLLVLVISVMIESPPPKEASETEEELELKREFEIEGEFETGNGDAGFSFLRGSLIGTGGAALSLLVWAVLFSVLSSKIPLAGLTGLTGLQWSFFPWVFVGIWIAGGGVLGALGGGLVSLTRK